MCIDHSGSWTLNGWSKTDICEVAVVDDVGKQKLKAMSEGKLESTRRTV